MYARDPIHEGTIGDSCQGPRGSRRRSFGPESRLLSVVTKENTCRKIWIAAEAADEVYKLLKPWVKPQKRAPPRIKLDNGRWARTPDEAAKQWRLQYEATFKCHVTTCAELAASQGEACCRQGTLLGDRATHGG